LSRAGVLARGAAGERGDQGEGAETFSEHMSIKDSELH
jgi:hypothetical protein